MKFSFQTVWIIFGVTLAHLFVISALSPAGGARRDLVSTADPDPASSPGKETQPTGADSVSASRASVPAEVTPKEENSTEITQGSESPAITTGEISIPPVNAITQPQAKVESLVETATAERPAVPVDPPAISSPPRVIREIRDLKPVRRS